MLDDEGLWHPPPLEHLVVAVGARLHLLGRVGQLPLHFVRLGVLRGHELGLGRIIVSRLNLKLRIQKKPDKKFQFVSLKNDFIRRFI